MLLGWEHIKDITAYDHIVFIIALCAPYHWKDWKKILILLTAFTIGHSLTLAMSVLQIILVPSNTIEILIPITIMITAIYNVIKAQLSSRKQISEQSVQHRFIYGMALFFGFIHGLGFSNYLKELLGGEESILVPLLAFNVGLELGQILIAGIFFLLSYMFFELAKGTKRTWNVFVSGAAFGISLTILIELLLSN